MGSPTFYWYPDPGGSLEKTALPEELTRLETEAPDIVADAVTVGGTMTRFWLSPRRRVRIVLERVASLNTCAMERELRALENHLRRGGRCGFALDAAKVWATVTSTAPTRGDTSLRVTSNGFTAWEPSGTIAANDRIIIETAAPSWYAEKQVASAYSDPTVTAPVTFSYSSAPIVRYADFWPVLYLEASETRPMVTDDGRRTWTLDVTLTYDLEAHFALWTEGAPYALFGGASGLGLEPGQVEGPLALNDTTAPPLGSQRTLDGILADRMSSRWRWQNGGGRL